MGIAKYRIASKEKESKSAELLYDTQLKAVPRKPHLKNKKDHKKQPSPCYLA